MDIDHENPRKCAYLFIYLFIHDANVVISLRIIPPHWNEMRVFVDMSVHESRNDLMFRNFVFIKEEGGAKLKSKWGKFCEKREESKNFMLKTGT